MIDLLSGHSDVVNVVKFFTASPGVLLSGSADQKLLIWKKIAPSNRFLLTQTLSNHSSSINSIAVSNHTSKLFASGSADAVVNIWSFDAEESAAALVQTIQITPRFFPLALALSPLTRKSPSDSFILAVAGTKNIIQLYVLDPERSSDFSLQVTLTSHEGWIRSLEFTQENKSPLSDIFLASASQDKYIRLWRLHQETCFDKEAAAVGSISTEYSENFVKGCDKSLSNKLHRFYAKSIECVVTFEALLCGHDDWIYSAKWNPSGDKLQLLSASADNSLAIWESDPSTGVFTITARMGEINSEKGSTSATGTTGGFWTGLWSPSGHSVACLGRTGSWRLWNWDMDQDKWTQVTGISGHTRAVNGISWSKNGEYLLSTSSDQTTRLHSKWIPKNDELESWHEMARPQIHGYDLYCIDYLPDYQFVSGAEEKLLRVFRQPKAVGGLLSKLCGLKITNSKDNAPDAANIPLLGLSNKKVEDEKKITYHQNANHNNSNNSTTTQELFGSNYFDHSKLDLDHPPIEDQLSKYTLWPEIEKLYGHGYEISALAVSHDGLIIATACKASSIDHAVIRLYETEGWLEVKPPLTLHSLTVTGLKFSADDFLLLSVGRDRQWAIFQRSERERNTYRLQEFNQQAHLRMILDAAWAPGVDRIFATAGRDKQAKIWMRESDELSSPSFICKIEIPQTHPVTAVDFLQKIRKDGTFWLAVGDNMGIFRIYQLDSKDFSVNELLINYPR